ncbi:PREDICTED: uncharacterized protein LOC106146621 [Chinchilla lanigera]|uniref:uncharacterized protein LOC106146621 n=1 Tax=Chinchilla lanigera TaxID=34839 RepID=UPI0006968862|nr:PREDICTED: uncharacterized protein LOC106146621 [Chinchilla lanigera]
MAALRPGRAPRAAPHLSVPGRARLGCLRPQVSTRCTGARAGPDRALASGCTSTSGCGPRAGGGAQAAGRSCPGRSHSKCGGRAGLGTGRVAPARGPGGVRAGSSLASNWIRGMNWKETEALPWLGCCLRALPEFQGLPRQQDEEPSRGHLSPGVSLSLQVGLPAVPTALFVVQRNQYLGQPRDLHAEPRALGLKRRPEQNQPWSPGPRRGTQLGGGSAWLS